MNTNRALVVRNGNLTHPQITFFQELSDLKDMRYLERFAHYGQAFWLVKLKHQSNRRELVLKCTPQLFEIKENGKTIKQVPAPSEIGTRL